MLKKMIAEAIGTFCMVFMGCGSIMISIQHPDKLPPLVVPIIFGMAVAVMIYAVGHISGAHFNPAVTTAFAVVRHFPINEVAYYWIAQLGGALLAIFLLKSLLPSGSSLGETLPSIVNTTQAVVWETIFTFFLMFVIIAVATDSRAEGVMAGAAIGGTVMLCAFIGGSITGASMNPARSLAPALFQGNFQSLWIYFLGPFLGSITAAFTYESIRCDVEGKDSKGCC